MAFGKIEKGVCSACESEQWIVHKNKKLCKKCNDKRKSTKANKRNADDDKWYREVFEKSNKTCEECSKQLQGFSRSYVSHILSKGAFPSYRYHPKNYNILCYECHQTWEFSGNRKSMNIWPKNEELIYELKAKYHEYAKNLKNKSL